MSFFDRFRKKKADIAPAKSEITRHCFVLCKTALPQDLSNASNVVSDVLGAGFSAEYDDQNIVTVMYGNEPIGFLAHMPIAIPHGEAEENADRNILWPDGRKEASAHCSHVIVTNIGGGDQSPIQSAIRVSQLALVALRLFDGIGVYWGSASVCNSREAFEEFCQDMSDEHVPVAVWLRFQPVRASDGNIGMYTLGMRQFNLMEIEVDRSTVNVGDLFEFVSNLAHYLIQCGSVIADGNTVGGSPDERILVRHRPSMIEKTRNVYKIVFES